jgi:hypothetical protein
MLSLALLERIIFFEICSSDRRARYTGVYTRTQANNSKKEPSHHFGHEKPCGIVF